MGLLPLSHGSNGGHSIIADAKASALLASPMGLASAGIHSSVGTTDRRFLRALLAPAGSYRYLRGQRHSSEGVNALEKVADVATCSPSEICNDILENGSARLINNPNQFCSISVANRGREVSDLELLGLEPAQQKVLGYRRGYRVIMALGKWPFSAP
jgi:hypothetical protein